MGWQDAPLVVGDRPSQVGGWRSAPLLATSPQAEVGLAEKVAGFPLTRFALGAASPFLGAAQFGLNVAGQGEDINSKLAMLEEAKRRGTQYWYERARRPEKAKGMDWWGLAGTTLSPATIAASTAIPAAATGLGRIGQGMALGTLFGAATPVTAPQDYWQTKKAQTGMGAATGMLIPGAMETAKTLGTWGRQIADVFRKGGPASIVSRYQRDIIGEPNIPTVQRALRTAPAYVPGSRPTAAEALVGTPEGSPIQAHQAVIARLPGGPSASFGQRMAEQEMSRLAAQSATETLTTPMRNSALSSANAKGGVPTPKLLSNIYDIANKPGLRASDVVQKTLGDVRQKISALAGPKLKIEASDLYTVRKELGNTIQKYALETQNWDKRLTAGLTRDVQKAIDDAMESAGGVGWKAYLSTYARQAQRLEADIERQAMLYKPPQRTSLGGQAIKEEELAALPHILTRPVVIGNYLLNLFKQDIQPAVQREAARRYLDPQALASALQVKPPSVDPFVWEYLIRAATVGGATGAAQSMSPRQP